MDSDFLVEIPQKHHHNARKYKRLAKKANQIIWQMENKNR
jgi:hypothetical protein